MKKSDINEEQFLHGIINNFNGARINKIVINKADCITNNEYERFYEKSEQQEKLSYSDEEIAQALANIVGKNKAIDSKQKWAGAQWFLRWECNYSPKAQDFCDQIARLQLPDSLEFKCDYNNIRPLSTLSFMNEDARNLDTVRYSKSDEPVFMQMRSVVVALSEELKKIHSEKSEF